MKKIPVRSNAKAKSATAKPAKKKAEPSPQGDLKFLQRALVLTAILDGKPIPGRKKKKGIPPGYVRCNVCGGFNGSTPWENLNWTGIDDFEPGCEIRVSCRCHNKPCQRCGVNKVASSGTNEYDEKTNTIGHWPWFASMIPCWECRKKEEQQRAAREQAKGKKATASKSKKSK